MAHIDTETREFYVPISEGMAADAGVARRHMDAIAERMAHPRVDLPPDHPARLPAGRVARWRVLAGMRLRARERDVAERLHRWLDDRYEFWLD